MLPVATGGVLCLPNADRPDNGHVRGLVSVDAINRVRGVRCTLAQKAVLTWLAEHAGPDLTCFPSVGLLAAEACACRATVKAALRSLEADGHITVDRRVGRSSTYTVACDVRDVDQGGQQTTRSADSPVSRQPTGGSADDRGVVSRQPGGGQQMAPNRQVTTTEPPMEPPVAGVPVRGGRPDWGDEDGVAGRMLRAIESKLTGWAMSPKQVREVLGLVEGNDVLMVALTAAANSEATIKSPTGYVRSFINRGGAAQKRRTRSDEHPSEESLIEQMRQFNEERERINRR